MTMKWGRPLLILTLGAVVAMQAAAGAEKPGKSPMLDPIDAPSLPPSSLPNLSPVVLPELPTAVPAAPAVAQPSPATPAKQGQAQTGASR